MDDCFRSAASILLLRPKEGNQSGFEMLLLHKPRKRDSWQLPQGGVEEGETTEQCAVRELREEAGISGVTVLGTSALVYQYTFPTGYRRFRPDHICGQRIAFIYALCPVDTTVTVDANEVDDFRWVDPAEMGKYLKRQEYLTLVQQLLREAMEKVN